MSGEFRGLLDSFTLALEAEGKSPKTVENYSRAVVALARWLRGQDRADDVTAVRADDVRAWLVSLHGHVAPSTEYRNYSGARQFFGWCVREEELEASPLANIRPPKVPEPRTEMLTAEQLRALLAGCAGRDLVPRRDRAVILLLADTGMRRAELAALTLDDIELRARVCYVLGKGRRPRRVRFGPRTAQAVDRYLRVRAGHTFAERPALWLAEKGRGVLTADGVRQMLERRGRAIGVRVHAHMFRHGFAHHWLAAGKSPNDLQELAGWKSPQMLSRYAAASRADRALAAYDQFSSPSDAL